MELDSVRDDCCIHWICDVLDLAADQAMDISQMKVWKISIFGMVGYWAAKTRNRARYIAAKEFMEAEWGTVREAFYAMKAVRAPEKDGQLKEGFCGEPGKL